MVAFAGQRDKTPFECGGQVSRNLKLPMTSPPIQPTMALVRTAPDPP
jgi:hypothetical protein